MDQINKNYKKIRRERYRHRRNRFFLVILVVIFGFLIFQPAKHMFVCMLVSYDTARWGVLEQKIPVKAVLIWEETVVFSPAPGQFEPSLTEGEKVPVREIVGFVQTEKASAGKDKVKVPVRAPRAGLVCYHPDGLEGVLKYDMLNNLDAEKLAALLDGQEEKVRAADVAESGTPLLKIVDNLVSPFLLVRFSTDQFNPMPKAGDWLTVQLSSGEKLPVKIFDLKRLPGEVFMVAETNNPRELDLNTRFISVNLIPASFEGIVIPKKALVESEGEQGVFVSSQRIVKQVPVEVIGTVGDQAAVSGLEVGRQFIVNPSLLKKGQRI